MANSSEVRAIELRYAGVVIGKVTVADPIDESGQNSLFVSVPDPLPVGTKVGLKVDDRTLEGRVIAVAESTDSAKCGMKIRIGGSATSAPGPANGTAQSAAAAPSSSGSSGAPTAPAPASESAPIDGAVAAEGVADVSAAQGEGTSDGASGGEEGGGQAGGQGGGRRRRRRR